MDKDGVVGDAGSNHGTLRQTALAAIDETRFVPQAGQNRLRDMIEKRPDWVLSRQRAWGVPICVFRNPETNEVIPGPDFDKSDELSERIEKAFTEEGADAWFADGARERFLDGIVDNPSDWEQVRDILDVWFDSGSTHAFCLEEREDLKWPADLYLEGSDQHRGWFHSSLLEACGTRGRAPYDAVLTHGFVMAEDSEDLRLGKTILQTNIDAYRKMRNTLRWMLGTLAHYEGEEVAHADMPELEKLMLHRVHELDGIVREGYDSFDFKRIVAQLSNFMNIELSAFYFDIRKDSLYCDAPSSKKRKAALHVVKQLFDHLVRWFAPILPFTMEESFQSERGSDDASIHMEQFMDVPGEWKNDALAAKWQKIRSVRRVVTGAIEIERREKRIGSSLEAAPQVSITDENLLAAIEGQDMAEICITSDITITSEVLIGEVFTLDDVKGVSVVPALAQGKKCARSWRVLPEVGTDPDYPDISLRDANAMREIEGR